MDGQLEFVLGDESGTVDKGDVLLAPPGGRHGLKNASSEPRRIMFIFPTTNVQRVYL
ncbi:MAG: cupin domain-containing protein [Chloroflexi bacterium]|nr:cupin domain-containing protein [Chloroflexota bacterium]